MNQANDLNKSDSPSNLLKEPIENLELSKAVSGGEFTSILCNKPQSARQTKWIILCIFMTVGMLQRYQDSVSLDLQEKGASYTDQSNFSLVYYPYFFKIFLAPLIDMFFFKNVGRCKTWIVVSCTTIAVALMTIAVFVDRIMRPEHIGSIVFMWFGLNVLAVFFLISGEMFVVKSLEGDHKAMGGLIFDVGFSIGGFISYNAFIPLNSVRWLNDHLYRSSPRTTPLVSHQQMLLVMGAVHLLIGGYILLFVSERKTETAEPKQTFKQLFKIFPKLLTNAYLRNLLLFYVATKFVKELFNPSIDLKFMDHNMSRATIANTDTFSFPAMLVASYFITPFVKQGRLLMGGIFMALFCVMTMIFKFWVLLDLIDKKDQTRTFWLYLICSVFERCQFTTAFSLGFVNTISPDALGSTFLTIFTSWGNVMGDVPKTIGLRLIGANIISYEVFGYLCFVGAFLTCLAYYPTASKLDRADKSLFSVEDPQDYQPLQEDEHRTVQR